MTQLYPAVEVTAQFLDRLQVRADADSELTGVSTGLHDLDRITTGLQPGMLVVVASRPGMGKTALALTALEHVAVNTRKTVLVATPTTKPIDVIGRLIGAVGAINQLHVRSGRLTDDEWPRLTEAIEKVRHTPIRFFEASDLAFGSIARHARSLIATSAGIDLILIDDVQMLAPSKPGLNSLEIHSGNIYSELKALAFELQCPIVATTEVVPEVEGRVDKRPLLNDIPNVRAIEQHADLIMCIYRAEHYEMDSPARGVAEVLIRKHRNGPTGVVKLAYQQNLLRFASLATGEQASIQPEEEACSTQAS